MRRGSNALIGIAVGAAVAGAAVANAAVATFTSRAAFDAATANFEGVEILDFDGVPDETLIPSGSSLDGVTFTYTIGDQLGSYELLVIDSFETTSGLHSLGLTFGDVLLSGDAFTMTFDRTIHAVGLFALASLLNAGEVELQIPGKGSVGNATEADHALPGGGGSAWFLGVVETDPAAPGLDAVDVVSSAPPGDDFEWNVDDVVSAAAPEPGSASALAAVAALAAMFARALRGTAFARSRQHEPDTAPDPRLRSAAVDVDAEGVAARARAAREDALGPRARNARRDR